MDVSVLGGDPDRTRIAVDVVPGITSAIAQNAPLTIGLAKAAAREIAKPESRQNHEKLEKMAVACFDSEDFKEGRRAFMEKRKPQFHGR